MTYKDENNNFYNFWDIMREKCFDRLSYFQELCLHGLNLGDGCCAVNYEKTNLKEDKTVDLTEFYKDKLNESSIGYEYDSKSDDDDDNENTLKKVKYNIGFRYSQSIVHNLYFKFVSYIFCNQITSMALNVSNISINQEKSYLNNLFCINKPHIKPFRDIWYPKGVKIVDQSLKKIFNEIILAFWFQDDGTFKKQTQYEIMTQGFDEKSVDILVECLNNIGYKSAYKNDTGKKSASGDKQFTIIFGKTDAALFFKTFTTTHRFLISPAMMYKFVPDTELANSCSIQRMNFTCQYENFHIRTNLNNNLLITKKIKDETHYYCRICNCESQNYQDHFKPTHLLDFQCSKCKVFSTTKRLAVQHVEKCDLSEVNTCEFCYMKKFTKSSNHFHEHLLANSYISLYTE